MGLFNRSFNNHTTFSLTPQGKLKSEQGYTGTEVCRILSSLEENGNSTAKEVSEDTGIDTRRVTQIMKILAKQGYVQPTAGQDMEG